ncbi:hypothetical protein [Bradyrhizobium sp. CCBAU 21360]|uniref:hypothetical protein n=1 Tax=Bradyrhizobium sp. CCBAU 21360 TaxID=1325081 RepID=UPI0023062DBE|nr:hypothetical protein [Bradyrhizobium sp. CCBAU 21360]
MANWRGQLALTVTISSVDGSSRAVFLLDEEKYDDAYPDYVCLAILEYYAFEAGANVKPEAVQNFRQLAGMALREFLYTQLGYSPAARVPDSWSLFHDRVSLVFHTVPHG